MGERPEIEVTTGQLAGRRFKVPEAGLKMGRASVNDIHLDDIEMSRSHCLFMREGEGAVAVLDLASANGTFVNGERLGAERRVLAPGDEVTAGETVVRVAACGASGAIDLGLGAKPSDAPSGAPSRTAGPQRSRLLVNLFWLAALVCASCAAIVLLPPLLRPQQPEPEPASPAARDDGIVSFWYEKVEADATRIFRYAMDLDASGALRVVCDDVPGAKRHVDKSARLSAAAMAEMSRILDENGWEGLEESYSGSVSPGGRDLRSLRIRVVRGGRVKEVVVENAPEPGPFRAIREAVEAFSRNELGIWAVQYSTERLCEMSAESVRVADQKWDERDVEYGNLAAAVEAYREALFYLETVEPKPPSHADARAKLERATAELDRRYEEKRFQADKAISLSDWDDARAALRALCEIVPKRDDPRHAEAAAKLLDVEKRAGDERKGGRR